MRRISILAGALTVLATVGCGSDDPPDTPVACLSGAPAYVQALETAPEEVRLGDSISIGDCVVEEQGPGAQAQVGEAMVAAATLLNRDARRDPGGEAAQRLGYLVGAVQEAASATGGIHEDLVRRLDAAARYAGEDRRSLPASFERAFGAGYAAGQQNG